MSASSKKPRRAWAKQYAGVMGSVFFGGSNSGFVAIGLQDAGEDQMHLGMLASSVARGVITAAGGGKPANGRSSRLCESRHKRD